MGAICSAPDAIAVENAAAHHAAPQLPTAEGGAVETPIASAAPQAANGTSQILPVEEEQQGAQPSPEPSAEHDACSDAGVQPACPSSSADEHDAAPEQEKAGADAERDSTSTSSPAGDTNTNAQQADSAAADAPEQFSLLASSCDTPSRVGDCASAGQIGPGKLSELANSQPQDANASASASMQQEAAEATEQCSAATVSVPSQARTSAQAPVEPQHAIHRTASNASSVISSSHVTTGVCARPSDDGSVSGGTAVPKRKQHRPSAQHLQQQQGRSKSVPRQQQLYTASGQPGLTGSRKDFAPSGARRQQPYNAGSPGYGPPKQKSMPQAMKSTQQYSSQSRLSKATAFAAAAVVRRGTQQSADSYTSAFPNYPDLPVLPNYPKYPTPPASVLSEEPSGQFQYDSGGESEKNLEDSVEWSELSSSLPPSCFGTTRVSRVMDGAEVQQMLGMVIGPDAVAAAHRLHDLVDTPRSSDSSSSGAAARPGVRAYHQPPPSLHQHIYPGCPYPLGPGSGQKAASAGNKAPGGVQSRMAAQPQVSNVEAREAAPPPRVGSGGLTSVAEEHIAEDPQLSQQRSGTAEEVTNGAVVVLDDPLKSMRLSQLSLASLPNASASQDVLGVSDMSSMAILA